MVDLLFHIEFTEEYPVESASTVTDQDALRNVEHQGHLALQEGVLTPKALGESDWPIGAYRREARLHLRIVWSCHILWRWPSDAKVEERSSDRAPGSDSFPVGISERGPPQAPKLGSARCREA